MSAIHVFIISWPDQYQRAADIAKSLDNTVDTLSIIYSDPGDPPAALNGRHLIRRDDNLFWADKFQACIEQCAPSKIMLAIHADCQCDDWPQVMTHCREAFAHYGNLGIWSPRLTGTP